MRVPLLDLSAQHQPLREEILAAMARVLDSNHFILGEEVAAFEADLAAQLGVTHVIGVSSGTDALLVTLMALGVSPGDEVVTTDYAFFATAGVVGRLGASPVFVDIDPRTFNMDVRQAQAAITRKTKAVLPVHLFGRPCDLPKDDPDIPIVEDAAQAIGTPLRGKIGCTSFFPSKNLGALGDAGAVYTNDDELAERIRMLRSHGAKPKYVHHVVGGNFRLDALQAAVLRVKLPHLVAWTQARRANALRYRELLGGMEPELLLPTDVPGHQWNQFVIRSPRRDELREHLTREGIGSEIYYPKPFHVQPCFARVVAARGAHGGRVLFPEADRAAKESLAIPVHQGLTADDLATVAGAIRAFFHL